MITCRLQGGIGNLMFQIAFIEYEGMVSGFKTGYWNVDHQINKCNVDVVHNPSLKHADEYLQMFRNFKWPRINKPPSSKINVPFHFETFAVKDNVLYDGFFQSEKYFPNRDFILNLFQPSDFVKDKLKRYDNLFNNTTCSIHVRRGDFLKYDLHVARKMDYFNEGMSAVGDVNKYLVFSDDIEWCKKNFIGDKFIFIENEKDYVELYLQSQCTHNIISSSTFSWWGAYLNNKPNRKIVGPNQWFSNNKPINNIIPDSWITI
jgi:hypothetical protein|tara:strand:+ start:1259 stop:2041 length:783 start_codon:yes stop_codon:yes gene_type:complete